MKKNLSKIIIFTLLTGIVLPGFVLRVWATDDQKITPLILQESELRNALVLDLKDAKDIKDLPGAKAPVPIQGEIEAKIKSFRIESPITIESVITDPVETGVAWLKNNQNPQGSWGQDGKTEVINTSAVVSLLKYIEQAPSLEYQDAIDWFNLTYPENSDYLAEKVISLSEAGQDISYLAEFLASQINERDGGFGYQKDYQSDIITTAKVLKAITAAGYNDPGADPVYTLKSVLLYLLQSQNPDGSWPKVRGAQSDIKTTTLVLEAFKPYQTYTLGGTPQGDIIIQAKIDLGINYLKNAQNPDGSWQDVEGTAKVYDVLLNYQQYPNYSQEALNYLTSNQDIDGSFAEQNIYVTAKALKAIAKPDIAVTNIQNISETIPNEPTVAEITIINLGYFKSESINFKAEPHAFHLIVDGEEVSIEYEPEHPNTIILEPNAQLILEVIFLNLAFGSHIIEFSVDYDEVEFDKTNNQKSVELIFDDPGFTGPEPPSWTGARTEQDPTKITVVWQFSEDPATTHYYLYLGSSPRNYTQYFDIDGIYNVVTISELPDNVPYYFSVASVDIDNIRGDYSMETSATAYNDPDNYQGTIPFSLKDNNQDLLYDVNLNFFGVGDINSQSYNPVFITTYPGHYYVTATKDGYEAAIKIIEIKANETAEQVEFILNIVDDGLTPAPIQNLQAQAGDGQITLTWDSFNDTSGDFKNFNIYRSSAEITDVSHLIPIDTSITDSTVTQFIDNTIVNGVDYYYAVTAKDLAGNENPNVTDVGPARGNSAPIVSNISANQDQAGQVQIQYDLTDNEQTSISIEIEYWDETSFKEAITTTGEGLQNIGTQKIITWNPIVDYPGYDGYTKIKIIADDEQEINNLGWLESEEFLINTLEEEEIQTGTFEIDYDRINELQMAVDEGHQPWRLDPKLVVMAEGLGYGFTDNDFKTMEQVFFDANAGVAEYEITHQGKVYIVTVIQPTLGEGKIWTISEIQEK